VVFRTAPLKKIERGFTIVEIMIVLAIAGLILLIVFEAVPALERGGRNSQRKQDVAAILQAVLSYELRNGGNYPPPQPPPPPPATDFLQFTKLSYYTEADVTVTAQSPPISNPGLVYDTSKVMVFNYEKCDQSTAGATTDAGADYRSIVALYAVETATGGTTGTPQCQQL
jgi:prepilin-type N-terminal cleavage/methylation domain-containing protein